MSSIDATSTIPWRPPVAADTQSEPIDARAETVIAAQPGWRLVDVRELWRYRELFLQLTWRDIAVRYKQTALGVLWVVLQPLAMMAAFTLFLARVGGIADSVEHYPLFVLTGLLAWGFFSGAIAAAASSVVGNQGLVTKVYFPRLIIPASAAAVALVDLVVGLSMLVLAMLYFAVAPSVTILLVPVLVVLLAVAAFGVGTLLAALTVEFRDFRYVVPFCLQFWMFITPTIYMPIESLGPVSRSVLPLNPAYGLILNFRNALLGLPLDGYSLGISSLVAVTVCVVGIAYFRRVERTFADAI
jgi:lipopolysaccharide transport system permease protein